MAANFGPGYRRRFGDTTLTKVFVGGLAWETPNEELRRYFEQFGDILEAVIITDKNTGRSKGYGFVTFREPESARRSVADPNPVIDGRRANCNIAALGRPSPTPPRGMSQVGGLYPAPPQAPGPPYSRMPAQMPPLPPQVLYPTPYGYMTYSADYGYQQAMYNPQITPQYYHQMYGHGQPPSSSSSPGYGQPYYPQMGYTMQATRANFSPTLQAYRPPYVQYPTAQMEGSSLPYGFQLHAPPQGRQSLNTTGSQSPQQPSTTTAATTESSNA